MVVVERYDLETPGFLKSINDMRTYITCATGDEDILENHGG